MAAMGAVKGFEDVVASILPTPADHEEMSANWSVTFATDDADATAEKATALGGKLLAPPFDAPWVRMTIIADPQGATFTASQFAPQNRDVPAPGSASVSA
jgi:predicted enzyme related to lactoylglutathione lyase